MPFRTPFLRLYCGGLPARVVALGGAHPAAAGPTPDTSDAPRGTLTGRVVDQTTRQSLPGAHVQIERLDRGLSCGCLSFSALPTAPSFR
jgi:type II secretory pathway component PulK